MALSDFEPFETLTEVQGNTTEDAARILFDLANALLATRPRLLFEEAP
jgi:hypothetical protein